MRRGICSSRSSALGTQSPNAAIAITDRNWAQILLNHDSASTPLVQAESTETLNGHNANV